MKLYLFAFIFFNIICTNYSFAKTTATISSKKLIVLGDSLTEGYGVSKDQSFPSLLETQLKNNGFTWTVINAGISGSTTASAESRLKWILTSKPDLILLILGGNDGLRGLKVAESEKNLSHAIDMIQKSNVKVILGGLYMPPNYGKEYTSDFKNMYKRIADKKKIPLIPFVLEKVAGDPKYNQADGIHPNEAGHKIISETIFNFLKSYL